MGILRVPSLVSNELVASLSGTQPGKKKTPTMASYPEKVLKVERIRLIKRVAQFRRAP